MNSRGAKVAKKRVLWIDSNDLNLSALKSLFMHNEKVELFLYKSLDELSDFIVSDLAPDITIIDESCWDESLKKEAFILNLNPLVFTGKEMPKDTCFHHFLEKPFEVHNLIEKVLELSI